MSKVDLRLQCGMPCSKLEVSTVQHGTLSGAGYLHQSRCDLVALKGDNLPVVVICELKLTFNLELILQGVDRATASDEVWLAARLSSRGRGRESDARFRNLCRRLGFGLLGILPNDQVEVLVSPTAPMPRCQTGVRAPKPPLNIVGKQ